MTDKHQGQKRAPTGGEAKGSAPQDEKRRTDAGPGGKDIQTDELVHTEDGAPPWTPKE